METRSSKQKKLNNGNPSRNLSMIEDDTDTMYIFHGKRSNLISGIVGTSSKNDCVHIFISFIDEMSNYLERKIIKPKKTKSKVIWDDPKYFLFSKDLFLTCLLFKNFPVILKTSNGRNEHYFKCFDHKCSYLLKIIENPDKSQDIFEIDTLCKNVREIDLSKPNGNCDNFIIIVQEYEKHSAHNIESLKIVVEDYKKEGQIIS